MQTRTLEEQSFVNLVNFYSEELKRIMGGESPETVFTKAKQKTLCRHGVLLRYKACISDASRKVLEGE